MTLRTSVLAVISAFSFGSVSHASVLFFDDFTTSAQSDDVNFEYAAGRQSGTVGNLQYRQGNGNFGSPITGTIANDGGTGYKTQIGNAGGVGKLWVVGGGPAFSFGSVSPEYNFINNPGLGNYTSISFTLDPVIGSVGTVANWGAITLGAGDNSIFGASGSGARGQSINAAGSHFGILFRDNGQFQAFDGSSQVSVGTTYYDVTPTVPTTHTVELRISGAVDGNPWDGVNDAQIEVYADGEASPFFTFTKTGGYTDNFITLQGFGDSGALQISEFDNLQIAIIPEPDSAALAVGGIGLILGIRRRRSRQ
jgi:MYXO-CTERM domain-containing protein